MVIIKQTMLSRETKKCELCSIGADLLFTFSSGLNSCLEFGLDLLHSIPYVEASLCSSVPCQALCLARMSLCECPMLCTFLCLRKYIELPVYKVECSFIKCHATALQKKIAKRVYNVYVFVKALSERLMQLHGHLLCLSFLIYQGHCTIVDIIMMYTC